MTAVLLLRDAASQTMNFDMQRLPLMQSALVNLFTRCGDQLTVEQCLDGVSRVAPDGIMDAEMCRIAVRFLARLPHDRLVRDVYAELVQDMDTDALDEVARVYDPVSTELQRDAQAVRSRGAFLINFEQAQELARDLEEKSRKVLRLEQHNAALEAALRQAVNGTLPVWECNMPSRPRNGHGKGPIA
ncbi:hypothetical protein [Neokomagataea anthophila]|uniref:Uncharacterized protein n=1 Tax=Neokomagataea anthophila TaxID=2826925 RepID=A0ABS5E6I6_9PROT|nr:hypothetical protein [Neokomagataea anthophila]MBR0559522.1 hypothetical protein [Neokomagataea anthophila]